MTDYQQLREQYARHYAAAEKLIDDVARQTALNGRPEGFSDADMLAAAQVHATLALAAATRYNDSLTVHPAE